MFEERLVMDDGVVFELRFGSAADYRLACLKGNRVLVEYSNARPYAFKSVENLRYDFERDAENALRQG
jgi:hypothetical protein